MTGRIILAALKLASSIAAQSSDPENSLPRRAANIDFASDLTLLKGAADRGLSWLAAQQQGNGSWLGHVGHKQSHSYRIITWSDSQGRKGDGHLGITALAGLAFLAGGHLPDRGKYGKVVRSQRLRAVGELSLGVSHNLNNILTGVLGPAGLIQCRPMTAAFFTRSARR